MRNIFVAIFAVLLCSGSLFAGELRCGDKSAPLKLDSGLLQLPLLVDRLSIEVFAIGMEGK